jgi:IMP dehydrogenase
MASDEAQNEYYGGMAEWKTAEGISLEIPYRETENDIITDIVGGLRSGLTYGGAANIQELQRKLDYIQVSWASRIEGLAHVAQG